MPGLGFTLITVPSTTYSAAKLNNAIGKYTMDIREFNVPQLRVGTLNVLISLSDTLTKLDLSCMSVVGQVEKLGREIHLQRFNPPRTIGVISMVKIKLILLKLLIGKK